MQEKEFVKDSLCLQVTEGLAEKRLILKIMTFQCDWCYISAMKKRFYGSIF